MPHNAVREREGSCDGQRSIRTFTSSQLRSRQAQRGARATQRQKRLAHEAAQNNWDNHGIKSASRPTVWRILCGERLPARWIGQRRHQTAHAHKRQQGRPSITKAWGIREKHVVRCSRQPLARL
ncbi:hypothetical protein TRVL_07644 [Trypanosoma vivax]|nr:hypothetical protein TRVL_07644 [Trypanosoma vivax]